MTLRPYPTADEAAVSGLGREGGMRRGSDPRQDLARKMAVNPEWFLVGGSAGRVVAAGMIGDAGHRGWINLLAAAPASQGGGQGRSPMAAAERILRAKGCAKTNRQVRATDTNVIAFYAQLGCATDDFVNRGKRLVDE